MGPGEGEDCISTVFMFIIINRKRFVMNRKKVFFTLFLLIAVVYSSLYGQYRNPEDINEWRDKTIMVFSPHPDDELYSAGTLAILAKNGNTIYIVQFCTGNAGSRDFEMTSERLAMIRKKEDTEANKIIGVPEENIIWLGYDDGMLEYVNRKDLCREVCGLIRKYQPDAVFSFDPGSMRMQWHKTDHRKAASVTLDAARAAAYFLVFPEHWTNMGLMPITRTSFFFFGSHEPNFKVDITETAELKFQAACQYISQFEQYKYTGTELTPEDKEKRRKNSRWLKVSADGRIYEKFRRVRESMSF